MYPWSECVCLCADLQEDAAYPTEQLNSLLGFILYDGVIGLHGQNVVLKERGRKDRKTPIQKRRV